MPDETLVWPHETKTPSLGQILRELLVARDTTGRLVLPKIARLAGEILVNLVNVYILGRPDPFPHFREHFMTLFNDPKAAFLADKYRFIETVAQINRKYRTPRQLLVGARQETYAQIIAQVGGWQVDKIFCKPVSGDNARGIRVVAPSELSQVLPRLKEDYILQEAMPFISEYRYAISRGSDGKIRRFCFAKVRPRVTGDGRSRLWRLILTDKTMTLRSKVFTFWRRLPELGKIIPRGETYVATLIANPPMGSLERPVSDLRLVAELDVFFQELTGDLEHHLNLSKPLSLICFDVGVLTGALTRKNIVPLECQMPFSAIVYFWQHPQALAAFIYFFYSALRKDREFSRD